MINNIQNYYKSDIVYDLLIKNNIKNIFELPKITKIYLNIGYKNSTFEKKKLINIILLLKLISNQQPIITKSKKNNIFLTIKKNSIVGCKLTLQKKNIFIFLEKLLISYSTKNKIKIVSHNIINFKIQNKNILNFFELKTEFLKFKNIPSIDVSIHTNTKNKKELYTLLNYFFLI